jgi:hypothetical protein
MSAARRFTFVLALALAILGMSAASALAQVGSPNPSGGTSLRPATGEGPDLIGIGDYLSAGFSIDLGLRGWLISRAVSQHVVPTGNHLGFARTLTAVAPRRLWGR